MGSEKRGANIVKMALKKYDVVNGNVHILRNRIILNL